MQPVMYLIANPALKLSAGKLAAQVAHAAVEAFRIEPETSSAANVKRMWDCGGHYAKVVLQSDDLATAERYINDRGFRTVLIIDEGRTELNGGLTPTCIGVEVVDKDSEHVRATFGEFKLYADKEPQQRDNSCYCSAPQEVDGSCMRCGGVVNPTREELIEHFSRPWTGQPQRPKPVKNSFVDWVRKQPCR